MTKKEKKTFSFENDLNFENLSFLLNELGIISHPLTNEQKVCIEYPNITSESKNLDILEENLKKLETEENKTQNNEFTLNISKNKNYSIDVEKLYKKIKDKCSYKQEIFTNSLKIFVSIFNNFNEDLFKWDLESNDLFNSNNKIQFFLIKDIVTKNNVNLNEKIDLLYKEHFENEEEDNKNNLSKSKINEITQNDDFVDDFDDINIHKSKNANNEDSFDNNLMIVGENQNENDIIFKNIYFLISLFNLMNSFYFNEFNIDNIMRNISLFNCYIINDIKILLLIHFNLCIQINLILSKHTVDNFLGISSTNKTLNTLSISSISSAIGSIGKTINFLSNDKSNNNKNNVIGNIYIPSIFFIDSFFLENPQENSDDNNEKIILFNFVIKTFIWTYFIRNKITSKIYIKIFNVNQFLYLKEEMKINQNIKNNKILYEFVKNTNYVNLLNDNLSKEYLSLMNTDFQLTDKIKLNKLEEFCKTYFPIFINCHMISFEIDNKDNTNLLNDFIEELNIIIWLFKFYSKIRKYKLKKYTLTFISKSFSFAIKKNKINKIEELYTKEITLFMKINHIKSIDLIQYLSDINNFNQMYKLYKSIIKCCNDYSDYDIGIRLFKDDIINKELRYYLSMIILKLQNYINSNKDIYKKLVLYENKLINPLNCVYLNIKKKLLKIQNKQNSQNKSDINFKIKEKNEGGVLRKIDIFSRLKRNNNDSNADRNAININSFYKSLSNLGLNHEEKMAIYNFIKEDKFYFTEFVVYSSKNVIFNTKNISYEPLNVLYNFKNNKCFIIITDMSFIDLYIYLTNSFDINFLLKDENNNENNANNNNLFFNAIISNIKVLKFTCKENFDSNLGHIQLRNVNIILNKTTFLQKDYFHDYKILFNENNKIYILDDNSKINYIFGEKNITLVSNFDEEKDLNDIKVEGDKMNYYEDYFTAFYSIFLKSYDIIKLINDKKLRKYNKLDIINNKKIFRIKDGKIQIKKIYKEEDLSKDNKINPISKDSNKSMDKKNINEEKTNINNEDEIKNGNNINNDEEIIEKTNDSLNENKVNKNNKNHINHNLFKIKELIKQNSYPLFSLMLLKETEISNLSFLFYAFEEIFLSKKKEKESKDFILKKIIKFLIKFKSSNFIPIIFNEKYFNKFLLIFNKITNKKESNQSNEKSNAQLFENVIFFPLNEQRNKSSINRVIERIVEDKNILNNLFKTIHIFKGNSSDFTNNEIGKIFNYNRVFNTFNELGTKSKVINQNENSILIYEIKDDLLEFIVKKNKKMSKNNESNNKNEKESKDDIKEKECCIF